MQTETTARLDILCGGNLSQLFQQTRTMLPDLPGSIVLAISSRELDATPNSPGTLLSELLEQRGSLVRIVSPPTSTIAGWAAVRKTAWSAVELPGHTDRLDRAWLPETIVNAENLVALVTIPITVERSATIALGLWAQFAHPRQRTGARLSGNRDGLTAEIALAVHPVLTILVGQWRSFPLFIASDDQIVAELAGLAATQLLSKEPAESGGPWENPLVQRAAELGVGIAQPGQIDARYVWNGDPVSSAQNEFTWFARDMLARIGISPPE